MPTGEFKKYHSCFRRIGAAAQVNRYFDLLKTLLSDLDLENSDPRLAMTITNKKMPVNLGQRYVLRPEVDHGISCIVPMDFEELAVNAKHTFTFTKNKKPDAKWIRLSYSAHEEFPDAAYDACLSESFRILNNCRRSGYRKFHDSLLYHFTTEPAVRAEMLKDFV